MKKLIATYLFLSFLGANILFAHDFESTIIPHTISVNDSESELSLSRDYFKNGKQSLMWIWKTENATLKFSDAEINKITSSFNKRSGVKIWIYNEEPKSTPLLFQFKDSDGTIHYTFKFYLDFVGWRAAWIAYSDMWTPTGEKTEKQDVVSMEIVSPKNIPNGKLWIDRIEFSKSVDRQATPDAQIPENNRHLDREIWHWGLLHKWEQQEHDLAIPSRLTKKESEELAIVYNNVKNMLKKGGLSASEKERLTRLVNLFDISDDGTTGAPLMQKDNLDPGDVDLGQLNNLLDLSARAWYMDKDNEAKTIFLRTIRYMLIQGFAYESGMGTNHHYGYQTRDIFGAVWWMEDVLREANLWDEALKAITYWSGLQEARQAYKKFRDEITDSWNTLLIPRLACALMIGDENERFRELTSLSRWLSGSLHFSPGTIGGIKIDGTIFHHGGHYPGYSVPGLAYVGRYLKCVNNTQFTLSEEAFSVLKFALLSISRQTNLRDWGIGAAGRHPFNGFISRNGVQTFAYAAMIPANIDKDLAGEYLRLMEGLKPSSEDNALIKKFKAAGISENSAPSGFYVYNYASQGIYRYKNKMISLKGFTRNVWGSEIYARDNRFGRYQSYGSVQIIGTKVPKEINKGFPVTEAASRYIENGWDWNRNPGTTTIHLPLDLLNSPFPGSDMLRQPESFSGASRLNDGQFGMFAMKLGERDRVKFNPSFKARKSVFCFDNRIICLGTGIENDINEYPTETTLFQQNLLLDNEELIIDNKSITDFPYFTTIEKSKNGQTLLKNLTGDYYYIPGEQSVVVEKKNQESKDNKKMQATKGNFASAYINHGVAPKNAHYEYMILLDAPNFQLADLRKGKTNYEIRQQDKIAHIVSDKISQTTGYAIFENYNSENDENLLQSDKEVIIMLQPVQQKLNVSVCYPDLNLGEYIYTTPIESEPITKMFTLKGKYTLGNSSDSIQLDISGDNTIISVVCQHGIPLEFSLNKVL